MTTRPVRGLRSEKRGVPPCFEGELERIGVGYFRRHHWRIASMYDSDDLRQEAYLVYLKQLRKHPELTDHSSFVKLYRTNLWGRVQTLSQMCFPNPYNMGGENKCHSLIQDNPDGGSSELGAAPTQFRGEVEAYLDLMTQLPSELRVVFLALVKDLMGVDPVEVRATPKLNGGVRRETFNTALARKVGLAQGRDLIDEIKTALGVLANTEATTGGRPR